MEENFYQERFKEAAERLLNNPQGLIEIMEFRKSIENIPLCEIDDETLNEALRKLEPAALWACMKILEYQVKSIVQKQDREAGQEENV